jgi:hypothetical protein
MAKTTRTKLDVSVVMATLIDECPNPERGKLLYDISTALADRSQYYTASLFRVMAEQYEPGITLRRKATQEPKGRRRKKA